MDEPALHQHHGMEVSCDTAFSYMSIDGGDPEEVDLGTWCDFCGFTPSPAALRMMLEYDLGLKMSEGLVELDDSHIR